MNILKKPPHQQLGQLAVIEVEGACWLQTNPTDPLVCRGDTSHGRVALTLFTRLSPKIGPHRKKVHPVVIIARPRKFMCWLIAGQVSLRVLRGNGPVYNIYIMQSKSPCI